MSAQFPEGVSNLHTIHREQSIGVARSKRIHKQTYSQMSLITSHKKKEKSHKRKSDQVTGKIGEDTDQKKSSSSQNKKKKEEPNKKLPPLVDGMSFEAGHRIFGWHLNKFTNQKTLRPCEVIQRSPDGSFTIPDDEEAKGGCATASTEGGLQLLLLSLVVLGHRRRKEELR